MTDPLDPLSPERIIPTALHQEMQRSYLEYAMSVIVGRALPDARDGLKPVQRRILYAMHELGLTPDRPFRKCARVVGDVLGKYHPHGDQAVYDALVRLVQDFSCRYPLLAGHGNFGSIDNDPAAAMRYTETRLAPISHEAMLGEIGDETVDFAANFDNSQQEPTVLPAQLPFLVLNGCSGIAVGMATNIPPHNLGEVIDGLIALVDNPELPDRDLMALIPGPDFPTGGQILDRQGIWETYCTGRGSIPVRGIARIEEIQPGKGRHRRPVIIVTELPYQVSKAGWIEKVADLVNQGKIEGIADIRDESDREGMRVVIELRRDSKPDAVLGQLYKRTPLQNNFGSILLALVDGQPRQLSLKQLLLHFLEFREETLTRRYRHQLEQTEQRLEIVAGLRRCLGRLDELVELLRNAPDGSTARAQLQVRFDLSERQADSVLSMPLRRLTGLEQENLRREQADLETTQARLQQLLGDRRELLKALKQDLRALKKRYASPRLTRIPSQELSEVAIASAQLSVFNAGTSSRPRAIASSSDNETGLGPLFDGEADEPGVLLRSRDGYVQRLSDRAAARQRPKVGVSDGVDDPTVAYDLLEARQQLLLVSRDGRGFGIEAQRLPLGRRQPRGLPLASLLPSDLQTDPQAVVTCLPLPSDLDRGSLILLTEQGRAKRLPLSDCAGSTARGLSLLKTKEDDQLYAAVPMGSEAELVLGTSSGRLLRLPETQLPLMGRPAQGPQVMRLRPQETLVGCVPQAAGADLLLISAEGWAKRLPGHLLRLAQRGDLGNIGLRFQSKQDRLVAITGAPAKGLLGLYTSHQRLIWIPVGQISIWGIDSSGDRITELQPDEQVLSAQVWQPQSRPQTSSDE